ncbi:phosphoesterase, partial [Pseudomonas sp. HMWF031]
GASYAIYTPANDHLEFRTIGERESATQARGQGFA